VEPRAELILANRAYLDHAVRRGSDQPSQPVQGGLLAAVGPVIAPWSGSSGTTWIGAGRGEHDREWAAPDGYEIIATPRGALRHRRLYFPPETWRAHYGSVANSFLWPLLHLVREPLPERTGYYPRPAIPSADEWGHYESVNRRFAQAALEDPFRAMSCWVHDYQLALVPRLLRDGGFRGCIGFFLHTPFPDFALARRYLDDRALGLFTEFVAGIAAADLAGFQTPSDAARFSIAARALCGGGLADDGLLFGEHRLRIAPFPVGVDVEELLAVANVAARSPRMEPAAALGVPTVVGLDRADYTKGIPERLRAVARAYRQGARFAYIGIAAPTREGVRSYDALQPAIESAAGEAAAAAGEVGLPFSQSHESVPWEEVVALQRDADVVFTSSLADGMNLVPLQAAALQCLRPPNQRCVILAGRDAGVSEVYRGYETEGLVPIDPLNAASMTSALIEALAGKPGRVSDRLVAAVREHDARNWATCYLSALAASC
jgi:trehalose-6-phosphate synthase